MVSNVDDYPMTTVAGREVSTLTDGFFHVATWFFVLYGSIPAITAWRQCRLTPNWSFHFGLVLAGRGISTWSKASPTTTSSVSTMYVTISMRPCPGT